MHGVHCPVPVLLFEDETKVKARIAWDSTNDVLTGFYGKKDDHKCMPLFKCTVGEGEVGYKYILEAFQGNRIGSFARVILVNPLHSKLPRLVLVVFCTYNCFDACWVRLQWGHIDQLWCQHCEEHVGPIVGHASDGDSRRRQLMLEDYTSKVGSRYEVLWEGFILFALLVDTASVSGLHD
jgi:hypothetical protein